MIVLYLLLALVCYSRCLTDISRDADPGFHGGTATVLQTLVQLNRAVRLTVREADFLRRIAYAELQDGLAERHNASSGGGIWAVDRSLFYRTQSSNVCSLVISKRIKIEKRLGIPWGDVQWSDLEDPLHSATAALLVILLAPTSLPPSSDLIGQALFWQEHYRITGGSPERFIRAVNRLEGKYIIQLRI